ncbi:hypothetical protein FKM82_010412 [Ascaphus truei]
MGSWGERLWDPYLALQSPQPAPRGALSRQGVYSLFCAAWDPSRGRWTIGVQQRSWLGGALAYLPSLYGHSALSAVGALVFFLQGPHMKN